MEPHWVGIDILLIIIIIYCKGQQKDTQQSFQTRISLLDLVFSSLQNLYWHLFSSGYRRQLHFKQTQSEKQIHAGWMRKTAPANPLPVPESGASGSALQLFPSTLPSLADREEQIFPAWGVVEV